VKCEDHLRWRLSGQRQRDQAKAVLMAVGCRLRLTLTNVRDLLHLATPNLPTPILYAAIYAAINLLLIVQAA